jgi:hypothetical protein
VPAGPQLLVQWSLVNWYWMLFAFATWLAASIIKKANVPRIFFTLLSFDLRGVDAAAFQSSKVSAKSRTRNV